MGIHCFLEISALRTATRVERAKKGGRVQLGVEENMESEYDDDRAVMMGLGGVLVN